MKLTQTQTGLMLASMITLFSQCKDSGDVVVPDENELITSVTLNFKDPAGKTTSYAYKDPDGDGGNQPTRFDTVALKPNTAYTLTIEFLDESKTPVDNITEEIREKSDEHLLVYTPSPASLLTYVYGDKDANNYPIGLTGTATSGAAGNGTLKVQLRHQPGGKNGTPTPGSDDVNLDFTLKVQ